MIVLDTHAWIWWLTGAQRLGRAAARAIQRAKSIGIPAICLWEIAAKSAQKKLRFDQSCSSWLERALLEDPRIQLLPLTPAIAVASAEFGWEHKDPADRLIVATALIHGAALVTADQRIHDCGVVRCLWD